MKKIVFSLGIIGLCFQSFGQAKFIEKVSATANEPGIPYERFELPNGLTVLIHEDHSDPIVHVDVTYHVGSAREELGRSGFAHFYEHMMFQGSDHVDDEQHFKLVSEAGGQMNGSTNTDRTNYFETLPSNKLEMALWLEADRMGWLLDAVTQQKFEIQRATVKNERGQNYDNRPYGLIYEKLGQAIYPYGHPYSWSTIGYLEELDRATLDDLKKFFLRWYGPNNAVLTVAGDVKKDEVLTLVQKYFAPINRGPEVKKMSPVQVQLEADRYISYEDNIRFPALIMSFPTVPNFHPDEPALDVLSDILGGGKNSIFFKNFDKAQIAVQSSVSHPCMELGGQFTLSVFALPGTNLADMEKKIRESLTEFESRGVSVNDLNSYKARHESQVYQGLESVAGKAGQLAQYHTMLGNPNFIGKDIERYNNVTKSDVMRVYNQYIKGKKAVILSVVPKGQANLLAAKDNFKPQFTNSDFKPDNKQYEGLSYQKPAKEADKFDRSKIPGSGPNPVMKVPTVKKGTYAGCDYILTPYDELPIVSLSLLFKAGHRYEPFDKSGLATLTASLMDENTLKYKTEEIALELDKLGSEISIEANDEDIQLNVFCLKKNFSATMSILYEKVVNPAFSPEDFDRKKAEQLEAIANQVTMARAMAENGFRKKIYKSSSILSIPAIGSAESVEKITLEDVKNYYSALSSKIARMVVVGNLSEEELIPVFKILQQKSESKVQLTSDKGEFNSFNDFKIYFIPKEKAPQSEIRIGYVALPYDATGIYYKTSVANFPFGGNFNSRINLNLREKRGYTYGTRSGFEASDLAGPFYISGGFKGVVTDSSMIELVSELKNFHQKGITEEELSFTKSSLGQADALKFEAPPQKGRFLKRLLDYKLEPTYLDKQNELLKGLTVKELNGNIAKYFNLQNMVSVVVGDPKNIEKLKAAGFTVEEMKP